MTKASKTRMLTCEGCDNTLNLPRRYSVRTTQPQKEYAAWPDGYDCRASKISAASPCARTVSLLTNARSGCGHVAGGQLQNRVHVLPQLTGLWSHQLGRPKGFRLY